MAMKYNFLPPTLNLGDSLEQMSEYNFVPQKSIESEIDYAMSNSFGFGGNCSSIVIKKEGK